MAYTPDRDDPFAGGDKTPALSWKGLAIGSVFTLEILEPAKLLHSRNFQTGELDYWDDAKLNPKLSAVVNVRVLAGPHSVGELRSVWAQRPSNLYAAVAEAQKVAQARMATGGTLHLKFAGEVPHENPRFSAIKQYAAKYEPPADAFAQGGTSQPQYAQPAQSTQQSPPPRPASWGSLGPATQPGWQPGQQPALPGSSPKGVGGAPF